MHRIALLLVAACHGARPVPPSVAHADAVLIALQAEAVRAADARDAAALGRLIADDWTIAFQAAPGEALRFSDKGRAIARWTTATPGVEALPTQIAEPRALVSGDTGVVWARISDRWHDKDGDHQTETAVTDVFARRDGRWIWVASTEAVLGPH